MRGEPSPPNGTRPRGGNGQHRRAIRNVYLAALANQFPVALWRYPHSQTAHAMVDFSGTVRPTAIDFRRRIPGFVFAPFVDPDGQRTLLIKAGLHLGPQGLTFPVQDQEDEEDPERWARHRDWFLRTMAMLEELPETEFDFIPVPWHAARDPIHGRILSQEEYQALVARAIRHIQEAGLKKIVTSRVTTTLLPDDFHPLATFARLCDRYAHAFVSLVAVPGIGTWMGASPETLLSMDGDALTTMALASTQPRPTDRPIQAVRWGAKEIEEQALVSDYVRAFFRQAGVAGVEEEGPHTVSAGHLLHLQTLFRVILGEAERLSLANRILRELHPTSAVCGMPKEPALAFIRAHEGYERSFYSGFLGPVHVTGRSDLFVNLRCMQLDRDRAWLYVGGGITPDSDPAAEWNETVLKSRTLLSVLTPQPSPSPTL